MPVSNGRALGLDWWRDSVVLSGVAFQNEWHYTSETTPVNPILMHLCHCIVIASRLRSSLKLGWCDLAVIGRVAQVGSRATRSITATLSCLWCYPDCVKSSGWKLSRFKPGSDSHGNRQTRDKFDMVHTHAYIPRSCCTQTQVGQLCHHLQHQTDGPVS